MNTRIPRIICSLAICIALVAAQALPVSTTSADTASPASSTSVGTSTAASQADVTASGTLSCENTQITLDCSGALADADVLAQGWIESVFRAAASTASSPDTTSTASSDSPSPTSSSDDGTTFSTLGIWGEEKYADDDVNLTVYEKLKSFVTNIAENGGETVCTVEVALSDMTVEECLAALDADDVMSALCADCPFELWWYDKTTGVSAEVTYTSSTVTITFTFAVIEAYADTSKTTTIDGITCYVAVSTDAATSAETAASAAAGIVSAYATSESGSEGTVKSILEYYKDEICELVSYDSDAADESYEGGYGEPWQLVAVFDGDDTTNVVCEGYAKAFQYLCDLTWPDDDEPVTAYCVAGTMNGGTGEGDHMWNLVRVAGHSYVCDLTNTDEGTIGEDGELFLASATDASSSSASGYTFTITEEDGTSQDVTYAYDSDTTSLFTSTVLTLDETDFPSGTVIGAEVGDSGLIELTVWDANDSSALTTYVGALTTYAVSGDDGTLTFTADASHLYIQVADLAEGTYSLILLATGFEAVVIVFCVASDGTLESAVMTESADCDVTGHIWDEAVSTATCTEAGTTTWTCMVCGETTSEETAALGHSWGQAEFTWADDSTATAVLTCSNDSSHITTATAALVTWTVTTEATQTTSGTGTLVATITVGDSVFTDTREVEIAALGTQETAAVDMEVTDSGTLTIVGDADSGATDESLSAYLQSITLVTATSTYGISYVIGFDSSTGVIDTSLLGAGDWTVSVTAAGYEDVTASLTVVAAEDETLSAGSVTVTDGTVATAAAAAAMGQTQTTGATVKAKSKKAVKVKGKAKAGKTTKTAKVKAKKLFKVSGTATSLSWKVASVKAGSKKVSKSQKKKFVLDKKTGDLKVKKGVSKGTYTLTVKVTVDGAVQKVKLKLKVK